MPIRPARLPALCAALLLSVVPATLAERAKAAAPWDTDFLPPLPAWHGASERLVAKADDPWITPAEATGLTATPSYAETRAYLDRLVAAAPTLLRQEVFGVSPEGRELVAVLAAKGLVDGPGGGKPDLAKPLLLVQAGIHAGEIDGKDAGLMLLRDITQRGKDNLLDRVNLLFVPIFNVDGHERAGPYNRPNQRGPVNQGWRTTAQNLNLNRDYGKLDTPEMRAMIALIRRYQPDLYLDIHVTDGMDYAYDITFGNDEGASGDLYSPAIDRWLAGPFKAAVAQALTKAGHIPGPLVTEADGRKPEGGITGGTTPLRFSIGYGNLVHIPTVLVENHSLKPYRQRVLGTYILVERALTLLADQGGALRQAIAADRARRPASLAVAFEAEKTPTGGVDFKTMAHEAYTSPASGGTEVRWLGRPGPTVRMPVYLDHPSVSVARPAAYWVPATKPEIIERLRLHGLAMETLDQPRDITLDTVRLTDPKLATETNEGHVMLDSAGYAHETRTVRYPKGSVRVPTDQPLGDLAGQLLEAESTESFLAWGYFPEILQRTEYIEPYAIAPLAERMLAADPALKAAFEAKLAADPAFAASPDQRLAWLYDRTPYSDAAYLRYPVGREVAR